MVASMVNRRKPKAVDSITAVPSPNIVPGCPLSLRERVRVRGNAARKHFDPSRPSNKIETNANSAIAPGPSAHGGIRLCLPCCRFRKGDPAINFRVLPEMPLDGEAQGRHGPGTVHVHPRGN